MENNEHVQCLIIGSGPAGYTAAIYASRANLGPVLYQGIEPGGQLTTTTEVENYPGYPEGIQGPDMMVDFEKQARRMGADIRFGVASEVDFSNKPLRVKIDDEKWISADSVILATGATAKWLGVPGEKRLNGRGVSACAVCDGFFFRGKEVCIVGGGDTAAEESLYLSKICSVVHMFVRRDEMRASKIMQKRVLNTSNIKIYWNTEVVEILGKDKTEAVRVNNNKTGIKTEIPISAYFVAIGHKPNSDILKGWLELDETGYVITRTGSTKTNIDGVFACGDLQDKVYRQAVTAAGTGCMAALDAERYLGLIEKTVDTETALDAGS